MIETYKNLQRINKPVTIQDIVVTENHSGEAGEFANKKKDVDTQKKRLFKHIALLAKMAAAEHLKMNFDKSGLFLQKEKENTITRLVTNEFAFYTRNPLSIEDFSELQLWINILAKKLPQNLHLVLSSFAVKTPDNKIMNVVAKLECGVDPKLCLIVKNRVSPIEPVYYENSNGQRVEIPYVTPENDHVDSYKINVNGKNVPFSFNTVTECETAGGAKFYLCIEICLDHFFGVAKKHLENILKIADTGRSKKLLPSQGSHIVTSNTINLCSKYSVGHVTHADPVYWWREVKQGAKVIRENRIKSTFGSDLRVFFTSPTNCCKLPSYVQSLIDANNHKVLNAIKPVITTTLPRKRTNSSAPANVLPVHPQVDNDAALPALITALRKVVVSTSYNLPEKSRLTEKDFAELNRKKRCLL